MRYLRAAQKSPLQPDLLGAVMSVEKVKNLVLELESLKTDLANKTNAVDAAIAHAKNISKGDQGIQGIRGPVGIGQKGDKGERGLQGPRGPKGEDGISPDPNAIVKTVLDVVQASEVKEDLDEMALLQRLLDAIVEKKLIKTEHIFGFEQKIAEIRNAATRGTMRGGGDTVTAGSNITITTDVNGKKVIASSGGSGFTELVATETPSGSTTVFTFAAATAQPTYLVVDNIWLKATTKSGFVNWTWNNGTKKATLTIPPNEDIWGVV